MNNNRWAVDKKEQCARAVCSRVEQNANLCSSCHSSLPAGELRNRRLQPPAPPTVRRRRRPPMPLSMPGDDLRRPTVSRASSPAAQPPMPRFVPSDDLPHPTSGGPSWRHCRSLLHHPGVAAVTPSLRELVLARIPFLRDPPPPPLPSVRCHRH